MLSYLLATLAIVSVLFPLEKRINTESLFRLFGFLCTGVGALVYLSGKPNLLVWAGVAIVVLTYFIDLWDYARGKPSYERRKRPGQ
jgi:hypothetical protein